MEMTDYQKFIYLSRYARWDEEKQRRETWEETVTRYCDFFANKYKDFPYKLIYDAIYNLEVMPSMRALMTAGPALERDQVAAYNCSYLPIDNLKAFDEIMYILMCGTGVGFSVEEKYVSQLPGIPETLHDTDTCIVVADSRIGWASALRQLIFLLFGGYVPTWDLSRVRAAGARLKTFGGRASGPEPLNRLFDYTCQLFKKAAGRKLTTVECHDLVCCIADVVIVGGVRRSALISLSDYSDNRMKTAKNGNWWEINPERGLANNSAVYYEKPDLNSFMDEWKNLYESKSGERGIFNRTASIAQAKRSGDRRNTDGWEYGTNPCGEIILRPNQFCNLSEVVIRPTDTVEDLRRKVSIAAIIGTFQSTLTNFRYLRKKWRNNVEEERLLGVSLTGIWDNDMMIAMDPESDIEDVLTELKNEAIETNKQWANKLGINVSAAVTCVKPSGTVSQLAGCSSGIHPSFSWYYWRTVRMDNKDALCTFLKNTGIRWEPELFHPESQSVFYFPCEAPSTLTAKEVTAGQMYALYSMYREYWCEHNPSTTIYYTDKEFLGLGSRVWNNWNDIGGVAFLPKTDHIYQQAPYIPISEDEYNEAVRNLPNINWEAFYSFEKEDTTTSQHDLACMAGACEL